MILLVCGSRTYGMRRIMSRLQERNMRQVIEKLNPETIIHGGSRGADELAHCIADHLGIHVQVFEADWEKYGRSAGPIRNKKMLKLGRPDRVVAFFDGKRTKGTMNMIKLAKAANVDVVEYGLPERQFNDHVCDAVLVNPHTGRIMN